MHLLSPEYGGLFLSCFLAATLLPLSSEAVLLLLLYQKFDAMSCLMIATAGNTLGGMTNYLVGRIGNPLWLKRFGLKEEKIIRFELRVQRHGYWLAFFLWVPILGDPMTAALGFFRVKWIPVLLLSLSGKFLRYFILILPFL